MQALMEAPPGFEPEESVEELAPLLDAVSELVDQLDDEHRYIVECIVYERLSFAQLGKRLGVSKTHAHRLWTAALEALAPLAASHPTIKERHKL
jgi:DNA-directed RNA polymerase specialized sigma subunit